MLKPFPTLNAQGWADGILGNEPKTHNPSYMRGYSRGRKAYLTRLSWRLKKSS